MLMLMLKGYVCERDYVIKMEANSFHCYSAFLRTGTNQNVTPPHNVSQENYTFKRFYELLLIYHHTPHTLRWASSLSSSTRFNMFGLFFFCLISICSVSSDRPWSSFLMFYKYRVFLLWLWRHVMWWLLHWTHPSGDAQVAAPPLTTRLFINLDRSQSPSPAQHVCLVN